MRSRIVGIGSFSALAFAGLLAGCSSNDDTVLVPTIIPPAAGDTYALTNANRLVTFNRTNLANALATNAITGLQTGETVVGIDARPGGTPAGELYALGSSGRLYTVNPTTGAATLKSTLAADVTDTTAPYTGLAGTNFGVDFNPAADRLRVVSDTGQNLRINVDTGATTTDGPLTIAAVAATGVSATAYTNSFAAACRTTLYYIDTVGDRLLSTADPNGGGLTVVGPLGVNAENVNGYDIVTAADGSNAALAVLDVTNSTALYTINLTTGAATAGATVPGLNSGETLRGLSAATLASTPTQATGAVLGVSETNKLISFNVGTPQKLCTSAAITGLQASENVLGIDTRPADGAVYALGSSGRIYTVNPATAAATQKSVLSADPTDVTLPYTALDGSDFGVDFNPVPDRLRVVSSNGQNLRINVDTGATTTDTVLNPAGATVTGAAYTNSVAGAGATTLYGLDSTGDRLVIQGRPSGNPNSGDLLGVGPLGVGDVQNASGFDIAAADNTAYAAVTLAGATTSDLLTVNLTTGAGTRVNTIGGGERVRGLAIAATTQANVYGVTEDNRLVTFRVATPGTFATSVAIAGLQAGDAIVGIDFRAANGRLYAATTTAGNVGRVYTIDLVTGAATAAATLTVDAADTTAPYTALAGTAFGVNFNPVADRLRIVSDAEQNLRSNVDNGVTTTDTTLVRAAPVVTAAAYTNSFSPAPGATLLYVIDTQSDRLLLQNPPNNGTLIDVGALGIDATATNGFEIVGPGTAVAVLSTAAAPAGLYNIDLASGAATLVGSIALSQPTDRITGLTALPSAVTPGAGAVLYAVRNGNALVTFARNAPGTVSAAIAITGLQSGELLRGIDYRPADSNLYGLGSSGALYVIDPLTGIATQVATLSVALTGTEFGVDFNPVADRLRVVSTTGQNLRIDVATGTATVDGALNYPAPDAVAAGYTRSFAGTTATQLFVIDVASGSLLLQNPPNDGVLASVGRLDPTLTFGTRASFDIAGGDDGLALAALVPSPATQSSLYRVNIATGAATSLGAIGPVGTLPLRGMALRLQ